MINKPNRRDLIAATSLAILLKIEFNFESPLLYYIASFQTQCWIQTGVTVQKRSIWVKIGDFSVLCDLAIWWMTLKNNRTHLLCYVRLYASFNSHPWIQTGDTVRKRPIWVEIYDVFFSHVTLKFDRWPWKINRVPLPNNIKLCVSFHHHMLNQTGVMVRKRLSWVLIFVALTFDLWPWPFE